MIGHTLPLILNITIGLNWIDIVCIGNVWFSCGLWVNYSIDHLHMCVVCYCHRKCTSTLFSQLRFVVETFARRAACRLYEEKLYMSGIKWAVILNGCNCGGDPCWTVALCAFAPSRRSSFYVWFIPSMAHTHTHTFPLTIRHSKTSHPFAFAVIRGKHVIRYYICAIFRWFYDDILFCIQITVNTRFRFDRVHEGPHLACECARARSFACVFMSLFCAPHTASFLLNYNWVHI